ncbi:MAG: aminopeptidase family protein, partial [Bryobacterales bacterium]|nr:aminopeptidase family protein [Bryobacterales bacterium]
MPTRRSFLLQAGFAPQAARTISSARPSPDSPVGQLKSRRSEARPITPEERRGRVERAQQLMREQKLNSICIAGGTTLEYFAGVRWGNSERLFVLVIPARGEPFYVAPHFEEERAREQIDRANGHQHAQVFTWQEDESPYALVAVSLKERGLLTGQIGIEETVKFVFADGIAKAAPTVKIASATPVTQGCRAIKSAHEMDLLRLASSITLQAYEAAWKSLKEGMTQRTVADLIAAAYDQLGFPGFASVQVGEYTALPHGSIQPQVIREGTVILIDDGCRVEGYQSDISRTFVLGKPSDKMKKVFDIVHEAQSAALAQAR